ncbi:hypothetical protein ACS3SW_06435 [Roseobacteraceae bacterium S113]
MVQNNKILTVSYGTFSCTLEGFEDSFDTMKAIAEYFRDLAADDRYFGAEPPTPDADMLARIAEKEIARRVDATMDDQGILLRAAPAAATAGAAALATGAAIAAAPEATVEESEHTPPPVTQVSENIEEEPAEDLADDVLETAQELDEQSVPDVLDAVGSDIMDDASEAIEEGLSDADSIADAAVDFAQEYDDNPIPAAVREIEEEVMDAATSDAPALDVAPDSVAAKLARIRAVVAGNEAEDQSVASFTEDEHADTDFAETEVSDDVSGIEDDVLGRVKSTIASGDLADDADDGETDAISQTGAPEAEDIDVAEADVVEEAPAPKPARQPVRVVRVKRGARKPKPDAEEGPVAAAAVAETAAPMMLEDETRVATDVESSLSDEDEDALMRELAEVEAELSNAQDEMGAAETDDFAENDDDAPVSDLVSKAMNGTFDDDPQDAPQGYDGYDEDVEQAEEDAAVDPTVSRSIRALTRRVRMSENATGQGDRDVSRLMAEADAQMEEPEGRNRRSAIAHLRAAVAATKEERKTDGAKDASADREAQFRQDLDAVRPRAEDADVKRAAPLKLVAEQRVDLSEDNDPRGPSEAELRAASSLQSVRPRRISPRRATPSEGASEGGADSSFMNYAEEIGAQGLPELLEAAAAYLTLVEKRPQFSRPQLMSKVREVEDADYSREDRLRYFGQLLREGKIEKTASGRFTASEQIGFRPDARVAG